MTGEVPLTVSLPHRVTQSQIAWLSLDEADNDLHRFFSYLIAALQEIEPAIGVDIQPILETESSLPIEPLLTTLLNDIVDCGTDLLPVQQFVLVLDDYYHITELNIHKALDFLIDHIPPMPAPGYFDSGGSAHAFGTVARPATIDRDTRG